MALSARVRVCASMCARHVCACVSVCVRARVRVTDGALGALHARHGFSVVLKRNVAARAGRARLLRPSALLGFGLRRAQSKIKRKSLGPTAERVCRREIYIQPISPGHASSHPAWGYEQITRGLQAR